MGGQLHFLAERVSSFEKERIVENSGKVKPRSRLLIANDSSQIMYKNTSEAWDGCRYEPSLPYLFTPLATSAPFAISQFFFLTDHLEQVSVDSNGLKTLVNRLSFAVIY